jgi:hypothetical protein
MVNLGGDEKKQAALWHTHTISRLLAETIQISRKMAILALIVAVNGLARLRA